MAPRSTATAERLTRIEEQFAGHERRCDFRAEVREKWETEMKTELTTVAQQLAGFRAWVVGGVISSLATMLTGACGLVILLATKGTPDKGAVMAAAHHLLALLP